MYFLKNNIFLIVLAIFAALLMIAPQLIYQYSLGIDYKGIGRIVNDDELYYLARANDIIGGHYFLGNPYIYELKNKPTIQFFIPDYILTKPIQVFNLDIYNGFFIYDIFLSIILTILTFICFKTLIDSRFWSLLGTTFLILGIFLLNFNRPVSPQFTFIFWLTQFIFIFNFIKNYENKYFWLSALNLGFLFYVYTYFWTFYYVVFILSLAIAHFFHFRDLFKKIFLIICISSIIGSYYFLNLLNSAKLPEYGETLSRLGMINTHWPSGIAIVFPGVVLFVLFIYFLYKKRLKWGSTEIILLSGIAGSIVAVNQQLITGKNLEFSSHYLLPSYYWFLISLVYLFSKVIKSIFYKKALLGVVIFFSLINILTYLNKFLIITPEEAYQQQYAEIFNWLNKNSNRDDVIFSNEEISNLIAVYTADNVFYSRNANLHFMKDEDVLERFVINNFFENFDENFIKNNERAIWGVRYIDSCGHVNQLNKLRKILHLNLFLIECPPNYLIEETIKYAKGLQSQNFTDLLNKYKINYIIWDANKNPNWHLNKFIFLNKKFEYNNIFIFSMGSFLR